MENRSPLEIAFLEDHHKMMRGLAAVNQALLDGDLPRAIGAAGELDRAAGPHIQFEEEVLYERVRQERGEAYHANLLHEHDQARRGVEALLALDGSGGSGAAEVETIRSDIQTGLEHGAHCGTLLSYLTTLDPVSQQSALNRLLELRKTGFPWHALPRGKA